MPRTDPDLLTRYYIYESVNGDPDGVSAASGGLLRLIGEEMAKSSQDALRAHFSTPPGLEGTFVAISENARRLRHVKTTVKATIGDVPETENVVWGDRPLPDRIWDQSQADTSPAESE